jgi:hypothetical protein
MSEQVNAAAQELFMQAYGALRYGSHGPTAMQWLKLGSALKEAGVPLPDDFDVPFKPVAS